MDLPRVLHLVETTGRTSGQAASLLSASGRTLPVVVEGGRRATDLPARTRRLPPARGRLLPVAAAARLSGTRIVHAHTAGQAARARAIATACRLPWSVTAAAATDPAVVVGASFVVVPDHPARAALVGAGLPAERVVVHGLGADPEPGALMALLESHWLAVLGSGAPAHLPDAPRALPTLTVLLATYQRRALLARCLQHLGAQTYPRELVQVVVVDNGSTDGSAEDLRQLAERGEITLITTGEPLLVTEARNRGLAVATGELVVFTDDDCRGVPTWLDNLVTAWLTAGRGIAQGRTTGDPHQPREVGSRTQETPYGYGLHETCNIAYPRAALGSDPFDDTVVERLGHILGRHAPRDGGEDADLGWRLRREGLPFCFSATALVHHEISPPDAEYQLRRARMTAIFPVLVERYPELRRSFLVARVFVHRQRPHWWLAAAAPAAVAAWGLPGLVPAAPYAWALLQPGTPGLRGRVKALPTTLRADALTSVSLLRGSWRTRTIVL